MSRLLSTEFNSPLVDPKTGKITKEWVRKLAKAIVLDANGSPASARLTGSVLFDPTDGSDNHAQIVIDTNNGNLLIEAFNGANSAKHTIGLATYGGKVGIGKGVPNSTLAVAGLPVFANNAAAITGGLTAGDFYRTGGDPDPVCVVH